MVCEKKSCEKDVVVVINLVRHDPNHRKCQSTQGQDNFGDLAIHVDCLLDGSRWK
jgi:hypothetical protein